MELGNRIKQHRTAHGWSQDDLAEKVYVSRQTISNWENDKSYPDLQSLLLLGSLFGLSLDQLVKGDIEIMQKAINQQDIHAVHRSAVWMTVFRFLPPFPLSPWRSGWAGGRSSRSACCLARLCSSPCASKRSKSSMMSKPTGRLPPFWRARLSMRFSSCEKAANAPTRISSRCWQALPSGFCSPQRARCSAISFLEQKPAEGT